MRIEHIAPASLVLHPKNPRTISPAARTALRDGIVRFGLVEPLVVQTGTRMVLGGHQRLSVAVELGHETVPVAWADVTDTEAEVLLVLLNNPSAQGRWDYEGLSALLHEWQGIDATLGALAGFSSGELSNLLGADWERSTEDLAGFERQGSMADPLESALTLTLTALQWDEVRRAAQRAGLTDLAACVALACASYAR